MEELEQNEQNQAPPASHEQLHYIFPAGLNPGILISSETIRKATEAEQRYRERKERKKKPPKPPSGKVSRIGGVALGNA